MAAPTQVVQVAEVLVVMELDLEQLVPLDKEILVVPVITVALNTVQVVVVAELGR
jgi:hypothetical protein